MTYYSERNGLKKMKEKSSQITAENYQWLFKVCEKYLPNLYVSRTFQEDSPVSDIPSNQDGREELIIILSNVIPNLFGINRKKLIAPKDSEEYDQNALLDFIEYIASECRTYEKELKYGFETKKIKFLDGDETTFKKFQKEINNVFQRTNLLYRLNDDKQVERIIDGPLTPEVEATLLSAPERGDLRKYLSNAIRLYRSRNKEDVELAINQLWDALESLKTYYSVSKGENTKTLVGEVIKKITDYKNIDFEQDSSFNDFLDNEFNLLTHIGNNYNVRHAGPNQKKFPDTRYYDYFFNRCLSLIALAIPCLK